MGKNKWGKTNGEKNAVHSLQFGNDKKRCRMKISSRTTLPEK